MIRRVIDVARNEFWGEGTVFGTGRFTEFIIGTATTGMGFCMLLSPTTIDHSRIISFFLLVLPYWAIAFPWFVGGCLSLVGLELFRRYGVCNGSRWMRFLGSSIGMTVFIGMTLSSIVRYEGELVTGILFAMLAFACYRSSALGFRRKHVR